MNEDLKSLADYELTSAGDKAWSSGDKERLAAVKAEKLRRANQKPFGLHPWVKVGAYLAFFVVGSRGVAIFGIGGLLAIGVGIAVSIGLTQLADYIVAKQQFKKAQQGVQADVHEKP